MMICSLCRRAFPAHVRVSQLRSIATIPSTPNTAPTNLPPSDKGSLTNSQHVSQSMSAPGLSPSISTQNTKSDLDRIKSKGSIPGGTELKGLAYLKAQSQVLALEDDEYPRWLWSLLDGTEQTDGKSLADLASMTKKQRAKYDRKQARIMQDTPRAIPLHEQSRDLTQAGDSVHVGLQKRQELTKSSREARRKGIRESNFLKGM